MRCPSCNHENREHALFCDQCAAELKPVLPPSQANAATLLIFQIRQTGRHKLYAVMAASAAVPCLMLLFRIWYVDSLDLGFLGWNLILAAIPFGISQWMALSPPRGRAALFAGLFIWLVFFPNAPYLITDLMHLSYEKPVPFWFDLALLVSFAWNGLMLGYLSLLEMQGIIEFRFGSRMGWIFSGSAVVLGSFGIYVGRYLRWNSWDLFTRPWSLLADVADHLLHPFQYPAAYGVTLMFSAFLLFGYLLLRALIGFRGIQEAQAGLERRKA